MDGKLVGTIIGYDRRTRIATILPSIVIKRFLDDAEKPPYEGFASPGFLWKPLIQPAKRSYLGLTDERSGVLVINTLPGSPVMGKLLPNDVILSFDGYPVDNLGFFQDAELGRLLFPFLANGKHKPGDTVKIDVIREKKKQVVEIPLANWDDRETLIPENIVGDKVPYLVEGGLIITELTGRYLRGRGQGWERMVGSRLAYYYQTKASDPEESGKRIVVLASVLPDQINIGYQDVRDAIITHINGKPVSSMNDVFRIAREDGAIERVRMKSLAVEIVLDKEQLPEANRRLAKAYRIDALRFEK
jgi:S1-C subfamily serine protease